MHFVAIACEEHCIASFATSDIQQFERTLRRVPFQYLKAGIVGSCGPIIATVFISLVVLLACPTSLGHRTASNFRNELSTPRFGPTDVRIVKLHDYRPPYQKCLTMVHAPTISPIRTNPQPWYNRSAGLLMGSTLSDKLGTPESRAWLTMVDIKADPMPRYR